jgi:hypothetical protein
MLAARRTFVPKDPRDIDSLAILQEVCDKKKTNISDAKKVAVLTTYATAFRIAARGGSVAAAFEAIMELESDDSGQYSLLVEFQNYCDEYQLDDETKLTLVSSYVDGPMFHVKSSLMDHARSIVEPDAPAEEVEEPEAEKAKKKKGAKSAEAAREPLPGQLDLPFDATKPSKDNLVGKTIKYHSDNGIVPGVRTTDNGTAISFTDENGEEWTNVAKNRVKAIKEVKKKVWEEIVEEEPEPPTLTLPIPAVDVKKIKKLLSLPDGDKKTEPQTALAHYQVEYDGYIAHVAVVNGVPDVSPVYLDLYVTKDNKMEGEHEPVYALNGPYKMLVQGLEWTLVIKD